MVLIFFFFTCAVCHRVFSLCLCEQLEESGHRQRLAGITTNVLLAMAVTIFLVHHGIWCKDLQNKEAPKCASAKKLAETRCQAQGMRVHKKERCRSLACYML